MLDLNGNYVLVTGGAGFVGSHIVDALVACGADVVVYDNFTRGKRENLESALSTGKVEVIEGDIRDTAKLDKAMEGVDYVFHEAALWLLECEQNPRLAIDVNIIGTFNILEAATKHKVKKVIAASSSSVYGDGLYFPTDENHPFNNYLFYGATKVADEQLLKAFYKQHGLNYIALRYLNVYGPRMDYRSAYTMVIISFLKRIEAGEPPIIYGDGSATLDLVYVEDVVRANLLALASPLTDEVFNVASGKETTLNELVELLLKLTNCNLKPIYQPRDSKLVTRRYGCPKKAKEKLGFEAKVSLEEGLKRVIEWWDSLHDKVS